ncbi:MAG: CHASE2 domain-containing protein [Dehalococcoidia bacterium]
MNLRRQFTWKRLFLIYSLPLIVAVALLALFGAFRQPDHFFLDQAFQWRGEQPPQQDLVIVAISTEDFEQGAPRWPWPRSLMARLVEQISSYEPAVIAIDILFTERSNTETVITREQFTKIQPHLYHILAGEQFVIQTEEGSREIGPGFPGFDEIVSGTSAARAQDQELADAIQGALNQGVAVVLGSQTITRNGVAGLVEPYPELSTVAGDSIGLVGVRLDDDGVLRRYLPYGRDKEGKFIYSLALAAVAASKGADLPVTPLSNGDVPLGDDLRVKVADGRFYVNFMSPPGTYPTFNAREVMGGEQDMSSRMQGKIVFLGVTDASIEDLHPTPFSGTDRMPGVEFHTAAADTILRDSFLSTTPRYLEIGLIALLALGAIALGRFIPPLLGFGGVLLLAGGIFGAWYGLFVWGGHILPLVAPLTATLAGFAVALTDRVSVEQLEKQQARSMLSRYLAPGVVQEMLKNPSAAQLGGDRANLTVLFSDIRGFTTLAERLGPEEVVRLLNEYLSVMTEVILRYEGTIDKFEGDGILAFFGAPQSHEDDPVRAIRTALEMRDRLAELEEKWIGRTHAPLQIGISINTGEAVVGNIGSQRRMDYTIIGDAVNLASRLQDLTKEYGKSILISGSTQAKVKEIFPVSFVDTIQVKGRQQPVDLYSVSEFAAEGDEAENLHTIYTPSSR